MNTRELICIGCPLGCALCVKYETDGSGDIHVINVEGNTCPKGKNYGEKEPDMELIISVAENFTANSN